MNAAHRRAAGMRAAEVDAAGMRAAGIDAAGMRATGIDAAGMRATDANAEESDEKTHGLAGRTIQYFSPESDDLPPLYGGARYLLSQRAFRDRIRMVRRELGDLPLSYAIKANPPLLHFIPERGEALQPDAPVITPSSDFASPCGISRIEVGSPGEMRISVRLQTDPSRVLYSGILKGPAEIAGAIRSGVRLFTAESPRQARLLEEQADMAGVELQILLRLSSGNQFGMDLPTMMGVLRKAEESPHLTFAGLHYYSGTQKKRARAFERDLDRIRTALRACEELGFVSRIVEYGPGLATECFCREEDLLADDPAAAEEYCERADLAVLREAAPLLKEAAQTIPLELDMGRFIAAPCGVYQARVLDLKLSEGIHYGIVNGGTYQLYYQDQEMASQVPVIYQEPCRPGERLHYCICGNLCNGGDVLVRDVHLHALASGDMLTFARCGAYSSTKAPALFFSRDLPAIYMETERGWECLRKNLPTDPLNMPVVLAPHREEASVEL